MSAPVERSPVEKSPLRNSISVRFSHPLGRENYPCTCLSMLMAGTITSHQLGVSRRPSSPSPKPSTLRVDFGSDLDRLGALIRARPRRGSSATSLVTPHARGLGCGRVRSLALGPHPLFDPADAPSFQSSIETQLDRVGPDSGVDSEQDRRRPARPAFSRTLSFRFLRTDRAMLSNPRISMSRDKGFLGLSRASSSARRSRASLRGRARWVRGPLRSEALRDSVLAYPFFVGRDLLPRSGRRPGPSQ